MNSHLSVGEVLVAFVVSAGRGSAMDNHLGKGPPVMREAGSAPSPCLLE